MSSYGCAGGLVGARCSPLPKKRVEIRSCKEVMRALVRAGGGSGAVSGADLPRRGADASLAVSLAGKVI